MNFKSKLFSSGLQGNWVTSVLLKENVGLQTHSWLTGHIW